MPLMVVGIYEEESFVDNEPLVGTLEVVGQQVNCTKIALDRLSGEEAKEMLESIWMQVVPNDLATAIYNRTGGNPLYIEEVAKGLVDEGVVNWRDNKWYFGSVVEGGLPKRVNEAILRRINHLSRETQTFLHQAAVFGTAFQFSDLHEMSDLSEWDALDSLDVTLERQFLKDAPGEETLRFSHAKVQEVLCEGVSTLKRRLMHREAGEALERQYPTEPKENPEMLAYHFFQAGEVEKGLIYSIQAAARSKTVYAHPNALHWYSRALDATEQLGMDTLTQQQRFELLLAREQIYHYQGYRPAQAADLAALQELAQTLHDPARQAAVHNRQAAYANIMGHFDEAITEAKAGLIAARQAASPVLEVESLTQLAALAMQQGQLDAAQEHLNTAHTLIRKTGDRDVEIECLNNLATLYSLQNNYAESEKFNRQALEMSQSTGNRYRQSDMLSTLGDTYFKKGDYTRAQAHQQQALMMCQFIGNRQTQARCLNRLAAAYKELGQFERALNYVEQALALHQQIEYEAGVAGDLQLLGTIHLAMDEHITARDYVGQALEIFQRSKDKLHEGEAWLELAMALEGLEDYAKASHAYDQSQSIQEEVGNKAGALDAKIGLARCLLAEGETDSAQQTVETFLSEVTSNGTAGIKYPVLLYLSAYRVLDAANSTKKAVTVLKAGHTLLQNRARNIADTQLQTSFLENVPENKALLAQLKQKNEKETGS